MTEDKFFAPFVRQEDEEEFSGLDEDDLGTEEGDEEEKEEEEDEEEDSWDENVE